MSTHKISSAFVKLRKNRKILFMLIVILLVGTGTFLVTRGGGSGSTSSHSTQTISSTAPNPSLTTTNTGFTFNETTVHNSSAIYTGPAQKTYVTSSAPNSSQWLIVQSQRIPSSVSSNTSGAIPQFSNLQGLNATKIGEFCEAVSPDGACQTFEMYAQTGWFWDSTNEILYIHYVGGSAVKLLIIETPSANG